MKRSERGLTLIEVLIATSLVGLLSVGMLWAIRVGVGAMGKANDKLIANRRVTGSQRVLEQQIAGFIPVTAEMPAAPGTPGMKIPFFQGEPQSMRFVSSYSLQEGSRGSPQILAFQVIPGDNGAGVRLIVDEYPYTGSVSAGLFVTGRVSDPILLRPVTRFAPIEAGPHSFVLADKLAYCNFFYQELRPKPEIERWNNLWTLDRWPQGIRIEMAPLDPKSASLHMVTVTAPLHVTRLAMDTYDDQ
jgi:prepilin-type N-terminal cleavage/methylation domain-containing protein